MNKSSMIVAALCLSVYAITGCVVNPNSQSGGGGTKTDSRQKPAQVQPDDTTITSLVKNRIKHKLSQKVSDNITVSTSNGVVILSGTVPNNGQRENAEKATRAVDGVRGIQNNLTIEDNKPKKNKGSKTSK